MGEVEGYDMRNPRQHWKPRKQENSILATAKAAPGLVLGALLVGAAGIYTIGDLGGSALALTQRCNIKGNISVNSGEHIYHVPGQEFYSATKISPQYGERWFCSEEEARAAGWRRAKH